MLPPDCFYGENALVIKDFEDALIYTKGKCYDYTQSKDLITKYNILYHCEVFIKHEYELHVREHRKGATKGTRETIVEWQRNIKLTKGKPPSTQKNTIMNRDKCLGKGYITYLIL